MKTLCAAIAAALVLAAGPAGAVIGNTYLTAYDKARGAQASSGRYGRQIRLRTAPPASSAKAAGTGRTSAYSRKVALCGKDYYTTKRGVDWIDAHRKAGHELVVRKHTGKRTYAVLCGKVPKRVRTARKTKPKAKSKD